LARRAYILLPEDKWWGPYRDFDIIFGLTASAKLIVMFIKIWMQTSYDVFFIDWEKPKKNPQKAKDNETVNVWRTIFTCNELNELQNSPLVTLEFTYIVYLFFMFGIGWYYWSSESPDFTNKDSPYKINRVLLFFVISFVFFCTGAAEFFIRLAFSFRIPLPSHNFIDLCSIANLSVIIFDDILHGYYIHGQSPGGIADTDSEELKHILENEGHGGGRGRGLDPNDPSGLQCFEIYISVDMRRKYDGLYTVALELEIDHLQKIAQPGAIGK